MTRHRWLVVEAMLAMFLARLMLLALPFERIAKGWGLFTAPGRGPAFTLDPQQSLSARRIAAAVASAACRMPFEATCLIRVVASHRMLLRRAVSHTLHMGAAHGQHDQAETHAWLEAGGLRITGFPLPRDMVELACFPCDGSPQRSGAPPASH